MKGPLDQPKELDPQAERNYIGRSVFGETPDSEFEVAVVRGQRSVLGVFVGHFLLYFLTQGFSLNLELACCPARSTLSFVSTALGRQVSTAPSFLRGCRDLK